MRPRSFGFLFAIVWVAASSCSTMRTFVDWDETVDFSHYRTFSFRKGSPARNDLTQRRIEEMTTAALEAKGLRRVSDEKPDLRVFTHVVVRPHQQINYTSFGYGWRWGGGVATVTTIPVGTLIVDLVDTGRREMVWRGRASDVFPPDRGERIEELQTAVNKIFEKYPPTRVQ
ncbi:MAG TPA: DUF4136 domain-containing protein [Thermoanaerobaculia bacterium]